MTPPIDPQLDAALDSEVELLMAEFGIRDKYRGDGTLAPVSFTQRLKALLHTEREAAEAETAKAYGGCTNCYGKGYATVNDRWHGHDTDTDIGSLGGYISGGNANAMKFCTCDRGRQLEQHINRLTNTEKDTHQAGEQSNA